MIYDSLDTIPYKIFEKIAESGDVRLLTDDPNINTDVLLGIWEKLFIEHNDQKRTGTSDRIFKISKLIDELVITHRAVIISCCALEFEYNDDLMQILNQSGFPINTSNSEEYYKSIERVKRESESLLIKAKRYQSMLPQKEEGLEENKYSIDDVMSSFSAILGFSIGKHNEVTYKEFFAYQRTVNKKIESLKSTKNNGK